jgi:hypothetical protein
MDGKICYLNADLDLTSSNELTELAAEFGRAGLSLLLQVTLGEDGFWHATFETDEQYDQPETNVAAMITVIESLPEPLPTVWRSCTRREFNIGYDCRAEPWAFSQVLSSELLRRIAAAGASLRVTLYPDREPALDQVKN